MPDDYLDSLDWEQRIDHWTSAIDAGALVHVAVDEADVVCGFVSSGPARDVDLTSSNAYEVYSIYVDEQTACTGVGTQLLRLAIGSAIADAQDVVVWVLEGNVRAQAFYSRHGFVADGSTKAYTHDGISLTEVRMIRPV